MGYKVDMIADTISPAGKRISTMLCRYPRIIHSELMTHRAFSRNASSSRAIPVHKMIDDVLWERAEPYEWGKNNPGMQSKSLLEGEDLRAVQDLWDRGRDLAVSLAREMNKHKAHKQIINRVLEPYTHINVLITATEWDNFFLLRNHEDADPTLRRLAYLMQEVYEGSEPQVSKYHLPFIRGSDQERLGNYEDCRMVSAARCARTSYLTHDGRETTFEEDLELSTKLSGHPPHLSPFEHQAEASHDPEGKFANFRGWFSQRYSMESLQATLGAVSS